MRGCPHHIKIEVSEDNAEFTVVANHNNSGGSIMTNIVLPVQCKGRYVRITPMGLMGMSPAIGMTGRRSGGVGGQSASGIEQIDASMEFSLSAIEIYTFTLLSAKK